MGILTKKLNCAKMLQELSMMLDPGEALIAAVFCSFQRGFFSRDRRILTGYLGVTDQHRLIGCKYRLFTEVEEETFSIDLRDVTKLRIKDSLYQTKLMTLKSNNDTMRIQISPNGGKKFPHQAAYFNRMLPILAMYQR
jgi:hypothetical protein